MKEPPSTPHRPTRGQPRPKAAFLILWEKNKCLFIAAYSRAVPWIPSWNWEGSEPSWDSGRSSVLPRLEDVVLFHSECISSDFLSSFLCSTWSFWSPSSGFDGKVWRLKIIKHGQYGGGGGVQEKRDRVPRKFHQGEEMGEGGEKCSSWETKKENKRRVEQEVQFVCWFLVVAWRSLRYRQASATWGSI